MLHEERGSVIVFAVIMITALTAGIAGISSLTVGEMRAVRSEVEEAKAFYLAEAGIEETVAVIGRNLADSDPTAGIEEGQVKKLGSGEYEILAKEIEAEEDSGCKICKVKVEGRREEMKRQITARIRYSSQFSPTVITKKKVNDTGEINIELLFSEINLTGEVKIEGEKREDEANLPEFNFNYEYYQQRAEDNSNIEYFDNQNDFKDSYFTETSEGIEASLPAGKIIYLKEELDMPSENDMIFGNRLNIKGESAKEPTIVVVEDDVNFPSHFGQAEFENVYFLVKGNFDMSKVKTEESESDLVNKVASSDIGDLRLKTDNTFIYTRGEVKLNSLVLNYNGGLMSRGDMDLVAGTLGEVGSIITTGIDVGFWEIKKDISTVKKDDNLNPQFLAGALQANSTDLTPVIISWQEE